VSCAMMTSLFYKTLLSRGGSIRGLFLLVKEYLTGEWPQIKLYRRGG
jgi:hypothetical protein